MTIAARVEKVLRDHGAHYKIISHRATGSTHESADAAQIREDHIAKAVVVRDGSFRAVAVIPGDTWLDINALSQEAARDFELDEESDLKALFPDCEPGAVPPVGFAYNLDTFVDEGLESLSTVYFEAGDHTHLIRVNGETFAGLMDGVRHGRFTFQGHAL
ncbi:MAG: YbaK/EbsC family protein [Sphingobacteriia bacterium]|nr:YbaK/EbsC family protein [Sphingobacteriia bacterium]NCC39291.1 YbaK/EbsC family protein [Gammaproteobacteria bacterium]